MRHIFVLSADHLDLAEAEVLALAGESPRQGRSKTTRHGKLLITEADFDFNRLAMTRRVCKFLFDCPLADIDKYMQNYCWRDIYEGSFAVRVTNDKDTGTKVEEKSLARHVWENIPEPKVDLKNPGTKIEVFIKGKKVIVGLVVVDLDSGSRGFCERRPHLRPGHHPTSINPKFARACVNLTGVPLGNIIVDPFCGTGGFLIEAGLMGVKTIGYDISACMISICRKNLTHFGITDTKISLQDATTLDPERKIDYIVSDLPYGKGSVLSKERDVLYRDFLTLLDRILNKKAVLIFPHTADHKKIIKRSAPDLKIETDFAIYVHKNLTRHIVVLGRKQRVIDACRRAVGMNALVY